MGDTECENFLTMSINKQCSSFHQKLLEHDRTKCCINTNLFQNKPAFLVHVFRSSMCSLRKLTFHELKDKEKECHLLMLLVLTHIQSGTQQHVIDVFPNVEGDEIYHIIDGTYLKCVTVAFISKALD